MEVVILLHVIPSFIRQGNYDHTNTHMPTHSLFSLTLKNEEMNKRGVAKCDQFNHLCFHGKWHCIQLDCSDGSVAREANTYIIWQISLFSTIPVSN